MWPFSKRYLEPITLPPFKIGDPTQKGAGLLGFSKLKNKLKTTYIAENDVIIWTGSWDEFKRLIRKAAREDMDARQQRELSN